MSAHREPDEPKRHGDVADIDRVEGKRGDQHGIRVRLVGHPHEYVVAVAPGKNGPRLIDLQIQSDGNATITPKVLRAVPSRRLAHAAGNWAYRHDGVFAIPSDNGNHERRVRPEASTSRRKHDDDHYRLVADRMSSAAVGGLTRKDVAADLGVSLPTLDRWTAEARRRGYLEGAK